MALFSRFFSVFILLLLLQPPTVFGSPKLVLLLSLDQLSPGRLNAEMLGGLGRLIREGRVFSNASLNHGVTTTCPGHVVIATGVNPAKAGIAGNRYIDHATGEQRYCVDDTDDANRVYGAENNRSPNAMTVTALGDWLKASSPTSRVYSVSGKDRAAITLGGKNPNGVYWYESEVAKFTSSRYYGPLPDYVESFNGENFFLDGFGARYPETWEHEAGSLRADDYVGESEEYLRYSGHPLNIGELEDRAAQFHSSPFLDLATTELAKRIIEEEELGQRGVTDLLAISYSSLDVVGHRYGPYSGESEDTLSRADETIGELLTFLDERLGNNYIVALTSDHGVLPLPEWLVETGDMRCPVEGGRVSIIKAMFGLYWQMYVDFTAPFDSPMDLVGFTGAGATVSENYAKQVGTTVKKVVGSLENYLEEQVYIEEAWTLAEMEVSDNQVARLYMNSFVPGKSPHLFIQQKRDCLIFFDEGTTHGTAYDYDRRVPLIFYGLGVESGVVIEEVHSIDIAPTLGNKLGLDLAENLDGRVLDLGNFSEK